MHQCTECGAVAAEPRLRYCEECGARMPEFKPPPPLPEGSADGAGPAKGSVADSSPRRPAYTGPKWLAFVPAHSPTSLGVILHVLALWLSILGSLAGVGPLWSFVMMALGLLTVAREYRASGVPNPLLDWIPESLQPPWVPAAYSALAVAICLPMLEFSLQPLLWLAGTVLVVRDQWGKVFAPQGGYAERFDPRSLLRGQRVLALAGVAVCVLGLFFTWMVEGEVSNSSSTSTSGHLRSIDVPRPSGDSLYGGTGGLAVSGFELRAGSLAELGMGATMEIGLLAFLLMLMLRPEAYRPIWLRFVPAGFTVIAVTWVLVNLRLKVGPIMFLAGLVPVGLVAALQALGRDEQLSEGYAGGPHVEDGPPDGDTDVLPDGDNFKTEEDEEPPLEEEEDVRG